jgi:hypothetical protein
MGMREVTLEVQIARIESQLSSFVEFATDRLDEIHEEVKKTNGRVSNLEKERAVLAAVREYARDQRENPDQQVLTVAWVQLAVKYGGWVALGAYAWWQVVSR